MRYVAVRGHSLRSPGLARERSSRLHERHRHLSALAIRGGPFWHEHIRLQRSEPWTVDLLGFGYTIHTTCHVARVVLG